MPQNAKKKFIGLFSIAILQKSSSYISGCACFVCILL